MKTMQLIFNHLPSCQKLKSAAKFLGNEVKNGTITKEEASNSLKPLADLAMFDAYIVNQLIKNPATKATKDLFPIAAKNTYKPLQNG